MLPYPSHSLLESRILLSHGGGNPPGFQDKGGRSLTAWEDVGWGSARVWGA